MATSLVLFKNILDQIKSNYPGSYSDLTDLMAKEFARKREDVSQLVYDRRISNIFNLFLNAAIDNNASPMLIKDILRYSGNEKFLIHRNLRILFQHAAQNGDLEFL